MGRSQTAVEEKAPCGMRDTIRTDRATANRQRGVRETLLLTLRKFPLYLVQRGRNARQTADCIGRLVNGSAGSGSSKTRYSLTKWLGG
jgi:hypothetical protein